MPHKFNATRRDKIPKQKYRVTNWAEYNESLRRRGDLAVWISDDGVMRWLRILQKRLLVDLILPTLESSFCCKFLGIV